MVPWQNRRARHFWEQGEQVKRYLTARKEHFCTAVYFFSVCSGMYILYIACLTECKECQAICLNWAPSSASECCSPSLGPRGETHSLAGEGVGGPNSNEGTDTLVLYVYYKLLYVSLWRYTEFYTWQKSRNSVKFRGISRNYTTRNSAEFLRNCSQFLKEYGIDGSKKNRRNSVSAEFRGHPNYRSPAAVL